MVLDTKSHVARKELMQRELDLKICIVTSSYPRFVDDAAGVFIHRMAMHLGKIGNRVVVVAPHSYGTRKHEILEGVEVYRFSYGITERHQTAAYGHGIYENLRANKLVAMQMPLFFRRCTRTCIRLNGFLKFDVFLAQWALPMGLAIVTIRRNLRTPVAIYCHATDVFLTNLVSRNLAAYALRNCELVFANSQATARRISTIEPTCKPIVIPLGVDLGKFGYANPSNSTSRGKDLLFVGRLTDRKGIAYLVLAMRKIVAQTDCRLTVVGDGPLRNQLEEFCHDNELDHIIRFAGNLPLRELLHLYSECHLVVAPSVTTHSGEAEGFPMVVLEAMAHGKAVVAGKGGGTPELVHDGVNGLLVDPSDVDRLSRAILFLLQNDDVRERMGTQGREMADNYSWDVVANRIDEQLSKLA